MTTTASLTASNSTGTDADGAGSESVKTTGLERLFHTVDTLDRDRLMLLDGTG